MVRRNRLTVANYAATLAATILLMLLGTPVLAQEKIPWTDLSLEERTILQQVESQWDSLSAERQQRLRRGANQWERMRPQERQQA